MDIRSQIESAQALKNGGFLWGAHHPHCDYHHNHLLWIAGHPLCLGCTCMYSGIVIGFPIAFLINWSQYNLLLWILIHSLFLVPTILQIRLQNKLFKIISRTLLGITISTYFVSGLFFLTTPINGWLFRILLIVIFAIFYREIRWVRNHFTKSPCDSCPLGYFPTCEWNMPNLLKEIDDDEFHEALASDSLQNLIVKIK